MTRRIFPAVFLASAAVLLLELTFTRLFSVVMWYHFASLSVAVALFGFAAGGVATPADAALMMQLGVDGVFVGSGIFKSSDPAKRANAIVKATTHFTDPYILAEVSRNLGEAMVGRQISAIPDSELQRQERHSCPLQPERRL